MAASINLKHINDVEACASDEELLVEQERTQTSITTHWRRVGAGVFGAAALVACGVLAVVSTFPGEDALTLRKLLSHPDVHDVVTSNIVKGGSAEKTGAIRQLVEQHFNQAGDDVTRSDPETANAPITSDQKAAVLHMMRYISDPRVQSIGVNVAHAIRDSGSEDPEVLRLQIAHKLAPRFAEMKRLHSEAFPARMRASLGMKGGDFEHVLSPNMIRILKTMDDSWDARFSPKEHDVTARLLLASTAGGWGAAAAAPAGATAAAPAGTMASGIGGDTTINGIDKAEEGLGISAAVVEEVSCLLRILKPTLKMFGKDAGLPPQATSAIGAVDALLSIASCETKAAEDSNPLEGAGCVASAGSAGMDSLREVFTLVGLLGDNNPANGVQGNHNDGPTVTVSPDIIPDAVEVSDD